MINYKKKETACLRHRSLLLGGDSGITFLNFSFVCILFNNHLVTSLPRDQRKDLV